MFLNFRIFNFRSINKMVELLMAPSDLKNPINRTMRTNPSATKNKYYYGLSSIAIYGPNASGKSNIVRALNDFVKFIEISTDNKPNENINLYDPFRLNNENLHKPSKFLGMKF
jgi:AAA15 family ATPase/GTPase